MKSKLLVFSITILLAMSFLTIFPSVSAVENGSRYVISSTDSPVTSPPHQKTLVRDSTGGLWCVFTTNYGGTSGHLQVGYSSDDGVTWTITEIWDDKGTNEAKYPSLCIDNDDVIHVVAPLQLQSTSYINIGYTNSTNWNNWVNVSLYDESSDDYYPAIAVDSTGKLHVIYEDGLEGTSNDDQIAYRNSTDGGKTWGAKQLLTDENDNADDIWSASIAVNSTDAIHIVLQVENGYSGYDNLIHMVSTDSGLTWDKTWSDIFTEMDYVTLDSDYHQEQESMIIDVNDIIHVAYREGTTTIQIWYVYNDSAVTGLTGRQWSEPEQISFNLTAIHQISPSMATTISGGKYIVWDSQNKQILYSHNKSNISWSAEREVDTNDGASKPCTMGITYPTLTSIPYTGFSCIYTLSGILYYFSSNNLSWTGEVPNTPPTLTDENPLDGQTGVSITPTLYVTCIDIDSDIMNATWRSNSSGLWVDFATNSSISTGTSITQKNSNFTAYYTKYWWSVNLTDSEDWINETYSLTTGGNTPPVISNIYPSNNSWGSSGFIPTLHIDVSDVDNDDINITWSWYNIDSWYIFGKNLSTPSGNTYYQNFNNATEYNRNYQWKISVNDGYGNWVNASYYFTPDVFFRKDTLNPIVTSGSSNPKCNAPDPVYNAENNTWHLFYTKNDGGNRDIYRIDMNNPDMNGTTTYDGTAILTTGYTFWQSSVLKYIENSTAVYEDGKYWLYFADSITNNIYYATSNYLDAPSTGWTIHSIPILNCTGQEWHYNIIGVVGFSVRKDTDGNYLMMYQGRNNTFPYGLSSYSQIGYANATTKTNWIDYPDNPVFTPSHVNTTPKAWDDDYFDYSSLQKRNDTYVMFYTGQSYNYETTTWTNEELGYATSSDMQTWIKYNWNPIANTTIGTWDEDGLSDVNLAFNLTSGTTYAFYEGEDTSEGTYDLGRAWSDNFWNKLNIPSINTIPVCEHAIPRVESDGYLYIIYRNSNINISNLNLLMGSYTPFAVWKFNYTSQDWDSNNFTINTNDYIKVKINESDIPYNDTLIPILPQIRFKITDVDVDDKLNITVKSNSSGDWLVVKQWINVSQGWFICEDSNMIEYDTTYYYTTNVTDSYGNNLISEFSFTTTTGEPAIPPFIFTDNMYIIIGILILTGIGGGVYILSPKKRKR